MESERPMLTLLPLREEEPERGTGGMRGAKAIFFFCLTNEMKT